MDTSSSVKISRFQKPQICEAVYEGFVHFIFRKDFFFVFLSWLSLSCLDIRSEKSPKPLFVLVLNSILFLFVSLLKNRLIFEKKVNKFVYLVKSRVVRKIKQKGERSDVKEEDFMIFAELF